MALEKNRALTHERCGHFKCENCTSKDEPD